MIPHLPSLGKRQTVFDCDRRRSSEGSMGRESTPQPSEPPSRRGQVRIVERSGKGAVTSSQTGRRRGRRSQEDYAKLVSGLIRRAPFELEECASLAQLPGVRRLAQRLDAAIFPTGTAIHHYIERAVCEVERLAMRQRDPLSQRIVLFLHIWYRQRGTVVAVADALGLSRSYVAHRVQPRALELVARRFLELAWRAEAS
jgi:hypothetical protein